MYAEQIVSGEVADLPTLLRLVGCEFLYHTRDTSLAEMAVRIPPYEAVDRTEEATRLWQEWQAMSPAERSRIYQTERTVHDQQERLLEEAPLRIARLTAACEALKPSQELKRVRSRALDRLAEASLSQRTRVASAFPEEAEWIATRTQQLEQEMQYRERRKKEDAAYARQINGWIAELESLIAVAKERE